MTWRSFPFQSQAGIDGLNLDPSAIGNVLRGRSTQSPHGRQMKERRHCNEPGFGAQRTHDAAVTQDARAAVSQTALALVKWKKASWKPVGEIPSCIHWSCKCFDFGSGSAVGQCTFISRYFLGSISQVNLALTSSRMPNICHHFVPGMVSTCLKTTI